VTNGGGQDLSGFSMLDLFRGEVETQASILNEGLLELENDPGARERLEALMRAAHSIKGAARIVEVDIAVKVSHAMEDCFVAAQEGKITLRPDDIDILLRGVDTLTKIAGVKEADFSEWLSTHTGEISELIEAIASVKSPRQEQPDAALKQCSLDSATSLVTAEPPTASSSSELQVHGGLDTPEDLAVHLHDQEITPEHEPDERAVVSSESPIQTVEAVAVPRPARSETAVRTTDARGRVVRVTAENLNRLMELAGESLVETRWLEPFGDSLLQLKRKHASLFKVLDKLREASFEERISAETIDRLCTEAREVANECSRLISGRLNEFEMYARRSASISDRLYREAISSRMRPFADGTQGFPRMVRDLARELGKKVHFEMIGKTTEVDRDILEKLEAPLNHLLRNALDHGIETPEERIDSGKPEAGNLRLEARHRAGMLFITVSDDGRGVDLERLRGKIVSKNMVSAEMAAELRASELLEFLFLPGFTTADKVSEISGRGVGMDIVHSMVQEVGGSVRASSQAGKGLSCHLQLPLTLSVIRALLVEIAGEPYAFPLARIDRTLMISPSEIEVLEDRQYFTMAGHHVGLVPAHEVLELPPPASATPREELAVVVASDRLNRYGLEVDRFLGERNLVVRPLDPRLGKVPDISAAALMEDGSPLLIIDVDDMVRSIDNLLSGGRLGKVGKGKQTAESRQPKRVLVVDDSITVREVERKLLENSGYHVEVAVDGMDGWNAVRTSHYDLVISDVDMPRMNGIELVRRIKQDSVLKATPVMIVSYKDSEEDRMKGLEAGANYYLTKSSFHDETLLGAVVDLIGEPVSV
jgi:two-component system sensor histidine kinase and response regulator WspE